MAVAGLIEHWGMLHLMGYEIILLRHPRACPGDPFR